MKRNGPKHRALIKEASSKAMTEYWKEWRRKRGIRRQKIRILCLCGCRNRVRQPGQKFVNGHNGSLILKHCYVGRYPLDIAYLPKKINIEVDGKYWHRNKKHRDRRRDGFLRKLGWVVIRVDSKLWRESKVWERL